MVEYPSISSSSKSPRQHCIAFEKYDGSNIRVKYTKKKGFNLFGSRTQLFDKSHPLLGEAIDIFYKQFDDALVDLIEDNWPNEREVIAFFEFFGEKSFAGNHEKNDPKSLVLFDLMIGHKNRKFLLPQDFVNFTAPLKIEIPKVIYNGNLNDQFIQDVREGKYNVFEGVVCKGTKRTGAARGNVWMAKIKTKKYLELIFVRLGEDGIKKFGE